ncbi:hypothetical protein K239x_38050 [Planctomycetes bacterium K23_9]|uniref:Uncharacterized protein n=1 Tax=Stieleria marina TaxID=1930275 RepID=A0A517NXD4_9BACT|nr:hypothetical protein K239x_38050 [Planctomycetes bacterium K23_9]
MRPCAIAVGASRLASSFGDYIDTSAFTVEHHVAVYQSVKRVVVALANATTRVPFVANLANQNIASDNRFAAKFLDAASLCIGVTAVAAGPLTFLMCHQNYLQKACFKSRNLRTRRGCIKASRHGNPEKRPSLTAITGLFSGESRRQPAAFLAFVDISQFHDRSLAADSAVRQVLINAVGGITTAQRIV